MFLLFQNLADLAFPPMEKGGLIIPMKFLILQARFHLTNIGKGILQIFNREGNPCGSENQVDNISHRHQI